MEREEEKIGGKSREENVQDKTAGEVRDGKGRETERQNTFTPQKEKKGHRKVLKGFQRGNDAEVKGGGQKPDVFTPPPPTVTGRGFGSSGGEEEKMGEDGGSQDDACKAAGRL